ncbi:MAG: epoxyqueuosine reductase [Thermosipho sp. (in: thermotogales)]|nr:epoxyqueuosine reductase [Thermosipho sp. (in: thermotogales)]MDN5324512.1 epoxyqueuosine reductase [Thermosipho sp. (in: thermotogales)]
MLLHVCCAPDLVPAFFHLKKIEKVYFYNPNIYPKEEYKKRLNEVIKLSKEWDFKIIESKYEPEIFYNYVKGYENLGENSTRCEKCIYLRLFDTALKAKEIGEKEIATTLTSSPRKNLDKINKIGKLVEDKTGIKYIETYFRKGIEYQKALKYIKEKGIYRQNYCGCVFSLKETEIQKQKKLLERQEKLQKLGFEKFTLDPEVLVVDENIFELIHEKFIDIIEIIRPKILVTNNVFSQKLNLKDGWNKLGKYNLKVKIKDENEIKNWECDKC